MPALSSWLIPGGDSHAPLGALDWQVQVYGTASPALRAAATGRGLALHVLPWDRGVAAKGLARDALYLVRPDGHVGLADAAADPATLEAYAERWAVRGRAA